MCTLALAWRVFDGTPVAVGANRDESYGRPSEPPARIADDPAVVAPRDAEAGGTWIGYNECGLFAGITNRWVEIEAGRRERSRGRLVTDCLNRESAAAAREAVERGVHETGYDGFNLVLADADDAFLLEWDGDLRARRLDPGVHVVVNVGADDEFFEPTHRREAGRRQAANARQLRAALRPDSGETADGWLARTRDALGDHEFGVCVHGDGFGTRSSSLIALGPDRARYEFADGPPCETRFRPVAEAEV